MFSRSVVFNSLWPWAAARQASLAITTPRDYLNWCPLSRWSHLTISSSVIPFSSCLQPFLALGSFPMSQFFTSDGQSIRVSASVLPMNIQDWFPLGLTGTILLSKGRSVSSPAPQFKSINFWCSAFFMVELSHSYMTTGKTITLMIWTFVGKVMSLLFNTPSRFVIAFLPRSL